VLPHAARQTEKLYTPQPDGEAVHTCYRCNRCGVDWMQVANLGQTSIPNRWQMSPPPAGGRGGGGWGWVHLTRISTLDRSYTTAVTNVPATRKSGWSTLVDHPPMWLSWVHYKVFMGLPQRAEVFRAKVVYSYLVRPRGRSASCAVDLVHTHQRCRCVPLPHHMRTLVPTGHCGSRRFADRCISHLSPSWADLKPAADHVQ
jgi:hypothetical protein